MEKICLTAILLNFVILVTISFYRSKDATVNDYFIGSRHSTWWLVSFGMISDILSGVTYVSVPGHIATKGTSYFFTISGYVFGNLVVCYVILPLFYNKKIISIYSILKDKINHEATIIASVLFFAARSLGSAARLLLSINLLFHFFQPIIGINIYQAYCLAVGLILIYTWKGGIKSLVWTDAYQSATLLLGFFSVIFFIYFNVDMPLNFISNLNLDMNPLSSDFFLKAFIGGFLITIAMYGLDQNMMQKNISCENLKAAQKNMLLMTLLSFVLNISFILLGCLLPLYYLQKHLIFPANSDQVLTQIIFNDAPPFVVVFFILGLSAATFSSVDSVLTTLSTSVHIELFNQRLRQKIPIRMLHFFMSLFILLLLFILHLLNTSSMLDFILKYSSYVYGPLLGIFFLMVLTKNNKKIKKGVLTLSTVLAILSCWTLQANFHYISSYNFGLELLAVNVILFLTLTTFLNYFSRRILK